MGNLKTKPRFDLCQRDLKPPFAASGFILSLDPVPELVLLKTTQFAPLFAGQTTCSVLSNTLGPYTAEFFFTHRKFLLHGLSLLRDCPMKKE
jgi:hypothetical protein